MKRQAALVSEIDSDPFGASDVVPIRLGDAVIARITQAIHDGRLKPGDALPSEARIATSFGVSKPIAREAIRQLAAMGVVHIQQGKADARPGARRRAARPLLPLRGARQQERPDRGGRAAPHARAADRALTAPSAARPPISNASTAILARMEAALTDVPRWIEADLDFHEAIAASAGNRLLDLQIRALRPVIREVMELFNSRSARTAADWRKTYRAPRPGRRTRSAPATPRRRSGAMNKHFEAAEAAIAELATIREEENHDRGQGSDRRQVLGGFIGLSFAGHRRPAALAQTAPLNVFAHRVMQTVSTGAQGGDITKDWAQKNGTTIQWTTFDTGPLQERLFREASLGETTVDVGFLLNTQAMPRAATLFEPLDDYLKRDPLEDAADIFPGLMEGMKVGGKQLAIPFRHASSGLHYNEECSPRKASRSRRRRSRRWSRSPRPAPIAAPTARRWSASACRA